MRLNLEAKTKAQQLVKEYLENNSSSALADKINNGTVIEKDGKTLKNKKTLDGFMKYASDEARKLAEKGANSACVEDEVVFGWAVHYFEEDSIEGTLFNEDGTEYKKQPSATAKAPTVKYTPPKPQPKPKMSMFDMFENEDNSGICATQSDEEPAEYDCEAAEQTAVEEPQNVDPETGEILSEEQMREFDGDIDESLPTVSGILSDYSTESSSDEMFPKDASPAADEEYAFDVSAFDSEAVAILSEMFGDEIDLR